MKRTKPRKTNVIPFCRPLVGVPEVRQAADTVRSGWLTTGPKVALFEERMRIVTGARHTVALNSCTAALHLSLAAAGVKSGDEVITSPYTFAATGEAILYLNAVPVFADIDPVTLNIDPARVARAISRRTRAIIPVHVAGLPCDMTPLLEMARRRGLSVIEDAAHALGGRYRGRPIGAIGDLTCFSFYATKNLTTGEGGMVATDRARLAERIRRLSLHGLSRGAWERYRRTRRWRYDVVEVGYKYNMSDLAASIGLAQLSRFPLIQSRRRRLAGRYTRMLRDLEVFDLPMETAGRRHAWHLYILRLRPRSLRIGRSHLIDLLARRGIVASVHFLPLHLHTHYRRTFGYRRGAFPHAERESSRAISLPFFPGLSGSDQDRVVEALRDIVRLHRR